MSALGERAAAPRQETGSSGGRSFNWTESEVNDIKNPEGLRIIKYIAPPDINDKPWKAFKEGRREPRPHMCLEALSMPWLRAIPKLLRR